MTRLQEIEKEAEQQAKIKSSFHGEMVYKNGFIAGAVSGNNGAIEAVIDIFATICTDSTSIKIAEAEIIMKQLEQLKIQQP